MVSSAPLLSRLDRLAGALRAALPGFLRCAPRPAAGRPSAGAAFGALVPVLSALFAIPLLGEWPSGADWAGIVVISAGVFLATGGAREPPGMIVPAAISACGKDG